MRSGFFEGENSDARFINGGNADVGGDGVGGNRIGRREGRRRRRSRPAVVVVVKFGGVKVLANDVDDLAEDVHGAPTAPFVRVSRIRTRQQRRQVRLRVPSPQDVPGANQESALAGQLRQRRVVRNNFQRVRQINP